ncbi:MAG: hypothetical protein JNK45_28710 [Myxococcales bacterium]|nr:hypothetical protein [Myxococcales bacterium]
MTVSTFDPISAAARRWLVALGFSSLGCRPGLPPEPVGKDAADADARTPAYRPRSTPYETSAFDGVRFDAASGHEGMNHGGKPMAKPMDGHEGVKLPADEPVPSSPHEGMDMTADRPKSGARAEAQQ